jgi:catecholate siderophore receptor
MKHSFNAGVEFDRETTDRSSYMFTPGTNNPLTGTFTCPTSGAATLYNCTTLVNPNPYDPWVYTRSVSGALTTSSTNTKAAYAFDTIEINPQWLLNLGAALGRLPEHPGHLPTATTAAAHARSTPASSAPGRHRLQAGGTAASTCPTPARRPRRATTAATAWMR